MGVYRATVNCAFPAGGRAGTNTWAIRTAGAFGTGTDVITAMGYIKQFYAAVGVYVPSSYAWKWDGTVRELGTPTPALTSAGPGWTQQGLSGTASYGPAASMVCVTWRTALATRRGRGRTFLGPVLAGVCEADGSISPVPLADFRSAAQALVNSSAAWSGTGAIAVWSEKDQLARDITAMSITDQFAVLRSRRS